MRNYGQTTYTPPEDATTESTDDDLDEIEIISTQIIHLGTPIAPSDRLTSTTESREEEAKRKRINRVVGFFATLIFLTCIGLVCSTLMMSKNIDELGMLHEKTC